MDNFNNKRTRWNEQSDNSKVLSGMFRDRESTERAYNTLIEKGYDNEQISVVMSDDTRERHYTDLSEDTELGTKAGDYAGKGSGIGGTVGAIAGVVAALGTSIAIPGLGFLIAGPLAAGLAGAGAGSITGGLIGALVGAGIPEARAKLYDSGIKEGNVVITVLPKDEADSVYIQEKWRKYQGEEIHDTIPQSV